MSYSENFPWQKKLEPLVQALLKNEKKDAPVNIILCDNSKLRELNFKYRGLNRVTDVLSFVWNEPCLLGEIYIAKGQVKKQALIYGNTYYEELKRVLIHGLLHLCGYNHHGKNERKVMRERELEYQATRPASVNRARIFALCR
jgi:probable rRNA maturation factor